MDSSQPPVTVFVFCLHVVKLLEAPLPRRKASKPVKMYTSIKNILGGECVSAMVELFLESVDPALPDATVRA